MNSAPRTTTRRRARIPTPTCPPGTRASARASRTTAIRCSWHALTELTSHHSAYYIDDTVPPAPLLIYNSFVDDLFPGDEAVRFWRKTVARHPDAEIAVHLAAGFGHPRAALTTWRRCFA